MSEHRISTGLARELLDNHKRGLLSMNAIQLNALLDLVDEREQYGEDREKRCALFIIEWLCTRNYAELEPALDAMAVESRRSMIAELSLILRHGGKPPNWA